MIDVGAVQLSKSPWAIAVVLGQEKEWQASFLLQKLNSLTVKDSYRIPGIQDTLDCLQGAVWFTLLDLKRGYWQVEPREASQTLTAFTVGPLRFYECKQMPFWLTNAPVTFQHLIETCLGDLQFQWSIIYLDDVIIFAGTPKEHLKRFCTVLSWLQRLD